MGGAGKACGVQLRGARTAVRRGRHPHLGSQVFSLCAYSFGEPVPTSTVCALEGLAGSPSRKLLGVDRRTPHPNPPHEGEGERAACVPDAARRHGGKEHPDFCNILAIAAVATLENACREVRSTTDLPGLLGRAPTCPPPRGEGQCGGCKPPRGLDGIIARSRSTRVHS